LIRSLTKQKRRLLIARIFAGVMMFVWFGNSLPPLVAMTRHAESCQMDCCKGFKPHSADSDSGEMCPLMAQKETSHEAMHGEEEPDMEQFDDHSIKVPIFGPEKYSKPHEDTNSLPYLRIKPAERCPETAFITNNGSNFGQRQQQSSENCLLFSFAVNLRPPTFLLSDFGTQISFKFTPQIWSPQTPSRGPPAFLS